MVQAFSASQLNTFLQCPYAWQMLYLHKIKTPKTENLFYGSSVHFGLEQFYRGHDPITSIEDYIRNDPKKERPRGINIEKLVSEGKATMEEYRKNGPYLEPDMIEERKVVDLENPKTHELLPLPFTFKIDLHTQNNLIVDFKTTSGTGLKQDALNRNQGLLYYLANRALYGKPPNGFLQVSLVKRKKPKIVPLTIQYSVDEEVWVWNLAKKVLDMIATGEYKTARPMVKSFYPCFVKDMCPFHKSL